MAKDTSEERAPLPPYISFKTLENFVKRLKETTVPARVDSSLLRTFSGSVARQLTAAMRYLALIEDGGKTTDKLGRLVKAYGTADWQAALGEVIFDAYRELIGDLNLAVATPAQLAEKFKHRGAEGQVLQKCVTFYLAAARQGGMTLSPHIMSKPRGRSERARGRPKRLRPETREAEYNEVMGEPAVQGGATVRFAFPIPEKHPATIFLPADLNPEDWQMIDAMVRAYIDRRQKGR